MLDDVHVDRYFREKVFPGFLHQLFKYINLCRHFILGAYQEDGSQVVDKKGILDAIIACRTATTKEQYFEKRASLFRLAEKVYVKPGRIKNAVFFTQYFLSNWDSVAPMWVYAYRKRMPLQVSDYKL